LHDDIIFRYSAFHILVSNARYNLNSTHTVNRDFPMDICSLHPLFKLHYNLTSGRSLNKKYTFHYCAPHPHLEFMHMHPYEKISAILRGRVAHFAVAVLVLKDLSIHTSKTHKLPPHPHIDVHPCDYYPRQHCAGESPTSRLQC